MLAIQSQQHAAWKEIRARLEAPRPRVEKLVPVLVYVNPEPVPKKETSPPIELPLTVKEVIAASAKFYGIKPSEITGRTKKLKPMLARQVSMFIARTELGLSYPQLGMRFRRNHTTILYGLRSLREQMANAPGISVQVDTIRKSLAR